MSAATTDKRAPPQPAYLPAPGRTLGLPAELCERIAATADDPSHRVLLTSLTIPPRSGAAWNVPKGAIFRLSTPEGSQVGDLNLWNAQNPSRERFWAARTRQLHATHVSTGDRLWSCLPWMRPMCAIVKDTLGREGRGRWGDGKGRSEWGGRCHDLLGTRCDPYVNKMLSGRTYDFHCHSNLTRAVLPYGLTEYDVHDVLNVFQVTGLDDQGRYFMEASPSQSDDYVEFFAEQDLLCALSTCPGGDLSEWGWVGTKEGEEEEGEGAQKMKATCKPIKVEVWAIAEEVKGQALAGWEAHEPGGYKGLHGLKVPSGESFQ
ncbi:hypothetical protein EV121DRAFT_192959 [Schizophyllum commune]